MTRGGAAALVVMIFAAAACSSKKQPPVVGRSLLADSADQVMWGVRFNLTDKGLERAQLEADTAFFFNDNKRIELQHVHTTFYTAAGEKNAVLTSRFGTYNSNSGSMLARKNVVVVSEDGRRLTTEELTYDQQRNEIASDSAFVLTEPSRRLAGIGFRSDPNLNNIRVLRAANGAAGQVQMSPGTAPAGAPPP